jgi:hypothetical protein
MIELAHTRRATALVLENARARRPLGGHPAAMDRTSAGTPTHYRIWSCNQNSEPLAPHRFLLAKFFRLNRLICITGG